MRELLELTEDFQVSRPVFRLTLERDGASIDANTRHPVEKYEPTPEKGNILSEMVCNAYQESFNLTTGEFEVDTERIADSAMDQIRSAMCKFLDKNLEMRNPSQSKIYKWYYRSLPADMEFNNTLVMVYKYMRTYCGSDMKMYGNSDHLNNIIALLTAIMEKHDKD